jgi:carbonic anhydrase
MRLFEAIISGNRSAGKTEGLPAAILTCIDPRLNALVPRVLDLPEDELIWLRNAGNIVTGPLSSTLRSIALACAVKGGKEIAVIGHTDCRVGKTGILGLVERFRDSGVERSKLPDDLVGFFGLFASERQNVINAAGIIRQSPLVGPETPVHGLLLDVASGRLEWLVNGYEILAAHQSGAGPAVGTMGMKSDVSEGDEPELPKVRSLEKGSSPLFPRPAPPPVPSAIERFRAQKGRDRLKPHAPR